MRCGLALDIASRTGCCWGTPDSAPRAMTWELSGKTHAERWGDLLNRLSVLLHDERAITDVIIEKPVKLVALARINTSEESVSFLRGGIGVAAAVAFLRGRTIWEFDPKTCRKSLTGRATFPSGTAKGHVLTAIRALGWDVRNVDESDAACLWHHWRGVSNPRLQGAFDPIFRGETNATQ